MSQLIKLVKLGNKFYIYLVSFVILTTSAISQDYSDGRPSCDLRMGAEDYGVVLYHGDGPNQCDILGARDVWVIEDKGIYHMHYDAAGPNRWLSSLAVSKDLDHWDPANKAIVLDGQNCNWSKKCIGLPSVGGVGNRLSLFYDAPGENSTSHMRRDVGLAWMNLPLNIPQK